VRLLVLEGDLTRKGIVRPADVGGSTGAPHASRENHSKRVDTVETRFGIISNERMGRTILEFKDQAQMSSGGFGRGMQRKKMSRVRNKATSNAAVWSVDILCFRLRSGQRVGCGCQCAQQCICPMGRTARRLATDHCDRIRLLLSAECLCNETTEVSLRQK